MQNDFEQLNFHLHGTSGESSNLTKFRQKHVCRMTCPACPERWVSSAEGHSRIVKYLSIKTVSLIDVYLSLDDYR